MGSYIAELGEAEMRRVGMIIFPGVQALDVSGPLDVFSEANSLLSGTERYSLTLVAEQIGPLRASNGMVLLPDGEFDDPIEPFDLLLVAGGPDLPTQKPAMSLIAGIKRFSLAAKEYGSICTGAFLLGHAGLLDGRRVATHWRNVEQLAKMFPGASVDPDRIYVKDGALITSAGITAGIDLALAIVAEHHGHEISLAVAKGLVVLAQRLGGQSQFSPYLAVPIAEGSAMSKVSQHIMSNLGEPLSVQKLADVAGMSTRSFARAFAEEVRTTPAEFVEQARVDAARRLLEGSDLPMKSIAFDVGFGSPKRMREAFIRQIRVSPATYRHSFTTNGSAAP